MCLSVCGINPNWERCVKFIPLFLEAREQEGEPAQTENVGELTQS